MPRFRRFDESSHVSFVLEREGRVEACRMTLHDVSVNEDGFIRFRGFCHHTQRVRTVPAEEIRELRSADGRESSVLRFLAHRKVFSEHIRRARRRRLAVAAISGLAIGVALGVVLLD